VAARPTKKSFEVPDERVDIPGVVADVVDVADTTVSRSVFQPGTHCPQVGVEGKPLCMAHHTGFVLDGRLHVEMADGSVLDVQPNEVFDIPSGHDGWAVGERALVTVSWAGFRSWAPEHGGGERVLVTLLFTDIVDSTRRAVELGDAAWHDLLAEHNRAVRTVLDRYRGREVTTTGDGFLATFDGAARAVEAALAIRERAARDGLAIRAGVHSGEVEVVGNDVRGLAVHEAARIAAVAAADEILVSETTRLLAAGAPITFQPKGPHELKGLPGPRELFTVSVPSDASRAEHRA
jgi:class 3 adenylate cyclase